VRMFRRTTLVAVLVLAACGGERDESSTPAGRSEAEPAQDAAAAGPDTPGGPETTGAPTAADAPGTADARATTGSSGITAGNDPTAAPPGAGEPRAGTTGPTVRRGSITGVSTQTAIRVGRQEGFDRVVFEFGSGGLPGYTIEYVERPIRQCGSGNAVSIAGAAWLRVAMTPARAHDDAGNVTVAERTLAPALPAVRQLRLTCDFEARLEWVVGVSGRKQYRVLELRNPDRVVVDILH